MKVPTLEIPKQCGVCKHWSHIMINKGICDHPAVSDDNHPVRGLSIYEHKEPPSGCPLREHSAPTPEGQQ